MKTLFLLIALVFLIRLAFAQPSNKYQFGVHGNIGFPLGEFRENVNNSFVKTGY